MSIFNDISRRILEGRYLLEGETPEQGMRRAAKAYSSTDAHAERLYEYATKGWMMFASPVLSNAGNRKGLPISCYTTEMQDDLYDIMNTLTEVATMSSRSGGVGLYAGNLRSDGTMTSRGNESTGMLPFIKCVDPLMVAFKQGRTRGGATAIYLDVSHPEIEEFISARKPTGGDPRRKFLDLHHAVNIPDKFMEAVIAGEGWELIDSHTKQIKHIVPARKLWEEILAARIERGEPYIHWIDEANRQMHPELQKRGLAINTSNLCVAPETRVLTRSGWRKIIDLAESPEVDVWNGEEWSSVTPVRTGQQQELIRVHFSDGSSIDCTPYHKFYIQNSYGDPSVCVRAAELKSGDKIEKFSLPTAGARFSDTHFPDAYSFGFYCGDGTKDSASSWVYAPKNEVVSKLRGSVTESFDPYGRKRWDHGSWDFDKFTVPLNYSLQSQLEFLAGYLDADACVVESTHCQNIQVVSVNRDFLHQIKLMLQSMGVPSTLCGRRDAGEYMLPKNDGTGESGPYECKKLWLLNINGTGVKRLVELGLPTARIKLNAVQEPQRDASRFVYVTSVEVTGRVDDTYCFTEPLRGRGVFNGIITGNCSEIELATNQDRSGVCCLSSLNLLYYDDWKDTTIVEDMVEMLDNVITVFVQKVTECSIADLDKEKPETLEDFIAVAMFNGASKKSLPLMKAAFSAYRERSLGLGTMGWHSYLQLKSVPFESSVAVGMNRRIFAEIKGKAKAHSRYLATVRGEAPDLVGSGDRNANILAIAPNSTSSLICGQASPSIEPVAGHIMKQNTLSGTLYIKNPVLDALIQERVTDPEAAWREINRRKGSVQTLSFLDTWEKGVFKTAYEIDQRWVVEHAIARQPYICQAQSVNLFFRPNADNVIDKSHVSAVHMKAWKGKLKTLYYCRTDTKPEDGEAFVLPTKQASSDECMSCQA